MLGLFRLTGSRYQFVRQIANEPDVSAADIITIEATRRSVGSASQAGQQSAPRWSAD
jgi:hypothetical protein